MLFSCGINSFVNYVNVSSLRPGVGIDGYTDMRLTIFEDDKEEVLKIVLEYEKNKRDSRHVTTKTIIRNIIEAILGNWIVEESNSARSIEIIDYPETEV
jgi:hypothetical protein